MQVEHKVIKYSCKERELYLYNCPLQQQNKMLSYRRETALQGAL